MRNKKFQLVWYQANDTAAMEQKLEKMAEKGWLLEKVTNWGWHYRRTEPQTAKYTVTFFPDASVFDGTPTQGQETYADYCAAAGWEFVSAYGPMQYFRSTRPNPTPIETDEAEKLTAIHKSMLKTWILSYGLLIVSQLLNLSTRISNLKRNPLSVLSGNGDIALWVLLITLMAYLLAFLADYFIWYFRSKRAVQRGEACLQPNTKARLRASIFLLAVSAISVLAWISEISSPGMAWVWVYSFGGMAALIGLSQGLMAVLKNAGCSRGTTKTAFIVTVLILSIAYASGMIPLANHLRESGLMVERQPAYVLTTNHGGMDMDWDIYRDELPVTLEDLGYTVTEEDHCSYEIHTEGSVLMKRTTHEQQSYGEGSDLPYLRYTVADVKWDFLLDPVIKLATEGYSISVGGVAIPLFQFSPADEPLFGADRMYVPSGGNLLKAVYLIYGSRIVYIESGDPLTEVQLGILGEKLNPA